MLSGHIKNIFHIKISTNAIANAENKVTKIACIDIPVDSAVDIIKSAISSGDVPSVDALLELSPDAPVINVKINDTTTQFQ